jgi:Ser/Thr protein kinase RdoA (MazF antagonist)
VEDRYQEVLKKYPFKVCNIYRARGAYLLETDCGLKLFKCFEGSRNRALFEHNLKEHLFIHGYYNTDLYVKTIEDDIIAEDQTGCQYIVKNWFWGEECNLKELSQIEMASANLAKLHSILKGVEFTKEQLEYNITGNLKETFEKRNRELKRVKGYIWDKRQRNQFEILYLNYYDEFHEQGQEAVEKLAKSNYNKVLEEAIRQRLVCHGNYNYHNIMMLKNKYESPSKSGLSLSVADISSEWSKGMATTNFEKAHVGIQIYDLYQFIRKVMEKNDWDILYGYNIIEIYDRIRPISKDELEILYLLLLYPEKFWKITNFYFNGKKVWISTRNIQKLNSIGEQNPKRIIFLKKLESIL